MDTKRIIIFAEANSVSDFYVPEAVRIITSSDAFELSYIVDLSERPTVSNSSGVVRYLQDRINYVTDVSRRGGDLVRYAHGLKTFAPAPFDARLSLPWWPNVNIISPHSGDVNEPWLRERIADTDPDVFLLLGCSQIVDEELLAVPSIGTLNCHRSLLPEYRGRFASFWAAYDGQDKTGVTFHWVDSNVDQGKIFLQHTVPIEGREGHHTLAYRCSKTGQKALKEVFSRLTNVDEPTGEPIGDGTYYSVADYQQMGFDPSLPAEELCRRIHASEGLWVSTTDGKSILVTSATPGSTQARKENTFGTVITRTPTRIDVLVGDGILEMKEFYYFPTSLIPRMKGIRTGSRFVPSKIDQCQ